MPKKMEKQGSERTNGGLEVQDGARRACWKKLSTGKWVMRPHAPARGPLSGDELLPADSSGAVLHF